MPINPVKDSRGRPRFQFEFDRWIDKERFRKRRLLPYGWTRAQADAYDLKESAALYAIATGIAKPRHLIDEAVTRYGRERAPELKHGAGQMRELEATRDWWSGRPIEDLPQVCAEYEQDQRGALKPATIKNRIAYLRAVCRWGWKRHRLAESDPGARVVVPTVRNAREVVVTAQQVEQLAKACQHPGVRALVRRLFYSGMRVSEAQRAVVGQGVFVLADTKNGSPRVVPMHPALRRDAGVHAKPVAFEPRHALLAQPVDPVVAVGRGQHLGQRVVALQRPHTVGGGQQVKVVIAEQAGGRVAEGAQPLQHAQRLRPAVDQVAQHDKAVARRREAGHVEQPVQGAAAALQVADEVDHRPILLRSRAFDCLRPAGRRAWTSRCWFS